MRRPTLPKLACRLSRAALLLSSMICASAASATVVADAANDFLPTFAGTSSGDLDVLSAFATYDGVNFHIGATVNGTIGTSAASLYVFGINRGSGTAGFAANGVGGVLFDSVITMIGNGVTGGRDLVSNTPISLPAGAATITSSSFEIDFAGSLLPSTGFLPGEYKFSLWSRDSSLPNGFGQIADFAPDNSVFVVSPPPTSTVPEPSSALLVAAGLLSLVVRRRSRA
jgi:hypothetical protein